MKRRERATTCASDLEGLGTDELATLNINDYARYRGVYVALFPSLTVGIVSVLVTGLCIQMKCWFRT